MHFLQGGTSQNPLQTTSRTIVSVQQHLEAEEEEDDERTWMKTNVKCRGIHQQDCLDRNKETNSEVMYLTHITPPSASDLHPGRAAVV